MLTTNSEYELLKESLKKESFHTLKRRILNGDFLDPLEYKAVLDNTKDARMTWWREARFGLFIHFGLYSLTTRGEWTLARDGISPKEYEKLAEQFMPNQNAAEEWVLTAKAAGAKYVVLTTRHHDGFSLWNSTVNPFNSCNYGCKRDIVAEFVAACRKHNMKIGFYSSLMDWYHPDAARMAFDIKARARFLQYLEELNIELLTNYGKIDILWYDMAYPNESSDGWNTLQRDQKLRSLQPDIIINDRGRLFSDFTTREEAVQSCDDDWESCLTFNTLSWGYIDEEQAQNYAYTPHALIKKLSYICRNKGNLLLNIGPRPDGTIAQHEKYTLEKMGKWLNKYKNVIYNNNQRSANGLIGLNCYGEYGSDMLSEPTAIGNTVYIWNFIWPKEGTYRIAGYKTIPQRIYYADTGEEIKFCYDKENCCIILQDLPASSIDKILGITIIAIEFAEKPRFKFCINYPHVNDGHLENSGLLH